MRSRRLYETRRDVVEALEKLARELNATVYLFGSYARGDFTLESDVDIIVVCECFKEVRYPDRVALVRAKLPAEFEFDVIALTPAEFEARRGRALFEEASRYWIEIKP
ncbi:MAG: nucleotidyltransferase domain-containing protein [Acidilobaceae archaeon]